MKIRFTLLAAVLIFAACSNTIKETTDTMPRLKQLKSPAPKALKKQHQATYHGVTLADPYHWLKDPGYPKVEDKDVLNYLNAENEYFHAFIDPNQHLVDTLFEEFKGRTDETEVSVPWQYKGYEYHWYYKSGTEYKTYSRKHLKTGQQQDFLDIPELAQGYDYFSLADWAISADDKYLAYAINTNGDERYTVYVRDLKSGELLDEQLTNIQGELAFTSDGKAIIYAQLDEQKWLARSINLHTIGASQAQDKIIYTEQDDSFFLGFEVTSSEQFLAIYSVQAEVREVRVVPLDQPATEPKLLASRTLSFSYSVDHANGYFYILANDTHKNSRLAKVSDSAPGHSNWQTVIAGSDSTYLQDAHTFSEFMVLKSRVQGIEQLQIIRYDGRTQSVEFPEPVFTVELGNNAEFTQDFVRLEYESMVTPSTVYDYALASKTLITKKVKKIPSGYDKSQYQTQRIMAKARDGAQVPVSIVYKKGYKQDQSHPLMLYGYGAYGITVDPSFSAMRLSLLDRGFAFAIAHVRGSDMLGHQWYLDGKLDKRNNTFNDFVDVAHYLIEQNYVAAGNISIAGRSAGGELMGAAVIQAPHLWRSVLLGVPFVDVLNTMLDASLPLTPPEWQEWGNPVDDPEAFTLLKSYSPYDNIKAREYPPMMLTGGINDPRVTYWEPAKFAAKMRATKTDDNLLLMRINMGAGHFANSGRYGRLQDYAQEYAFTLLAHGIRH